MKNITILFVSFLIIGVGFGQETEKLNVQKSFAAWEQFLATQAKYPTSALRSNKEGYVIMELDFDSEGMIKGANIKESSSKDMEQSALSAMEKAIPSWNPEMLAERKPGKTYQIVFSFESIDPQNPNAATEAITRQLYKGKPEKALKIVNRILEKKPFDYQTLEIRSQIHRQLGMEEEATKDLLNSQELKDKTLAVIQNRTFSIITRREVTGSFSN
ncbi:TonB family protein [Algoriphagus sp.]|uniref:TonB family protein n=1 Tax=Algoriphagus sp. TaxID=1872435 RepID=UPI002617BF8A|nr:TonB family protein [Algoriphagus sp.]